MVSVLFSGWCELRQLTVVSKTTAQESSEGTNHLRRREKLFGLEFLFDCNFVMNPTGENDGNQVSIFIGWRTSVTAVCTNNSVIRITVYLRIDLLP